MPQKTIWISRKFHVTVKSLSSKDLLPDASEHCWYWRQPRNIQTRLHAQVKNFYSLQHIGVKDTYLQDLVWVQYKGPAMYDVISQQTAMSVKHSRNPHSSTLYDCSRKLQKCFVGTYTSSYWEFRIQCQKHVLLCQQVSSECLECDKHLTFVASPS
jgi:hypothetical protein